MSRSFTFGIPQTSLALLSLNQDLLAANDVDAFLRNADALTGKIEDIVLRVYKIHRVFKVAYSIEDVVEELPNIGKHIGIVATDRNIERYALIICTFSGMVMLVSIGQSLKLRLPILVTVEGMMTLVSCELLRKATLPISVTV